MDVKKVTGYDNMVIDPNPFKAPESEVRDHVDEKSLYELASRFIRLIARILDGFEKKIPGGHSIQFER